MLELLTVQCAHCNLELNKILKGQNLKQQYGNCVKSETEKSPESHNPEIKKFTVRQNQTTLPHLKTSHFLDFVRFCLFYCRSCPLRFYFVFRILFFESYSLTCKLFKHIVITNNCVRWIFEKGRSQRFWKF